MNSQLTKEFILSLYKQTPYSNTFDSLPHKELFSTEQSQTPSLITHKGTLSLSSCYFPKSSHGKAFTRGNNQHEVSSGGFFDNFEGKVDPHKIKAFKRNICICPSKAHDICIVHNKCIDVIKHKDDFIKEVSTLSISVDALFDQGEVVIRNKQAPNDDIIDNTTLNVDPKVVEIKRIYRVNAKLDVAKNKPLWYIYHTAGKSSFGPLTSENIEQMYNKKMLTGESEVRLIDVYAIEHVDPFKYVKLKEIERKEFINRIGLSTLVKRALNLNNNI